MSIINAAFVCVFLFQIFLMCMFGQELMTENDALLFQLYSSNWPAVIAASKRDEPKSCHKMLIIFMETLKEDKQIMIGKVFPLNLKTFSSVSKRFYAVNVVSILNVFIGNISIWLLDIEHVLPPVCNTQVNSWKQLLDPLRFFLVEVIDYMLRTTNNWKLN